MQTTTTAPSQAQHTPGPWAWDENGHCLRPVNGDPTTSSVHTILSPEGAYGYLGATVAEVRAECDANQALIAAAPDLLDALVAVVASLQNHLKGTGGNTTQDSIRLGIAALAIEKALGCSANEKINAICIGTNLSALEAIYLLWADGSENCTQAAWAAFTEGLEALPADKVQQRLAAEGIEISADAVADLQIDAANKGPRGVLAIFKLNDEHPRAALDVGDRAGLHVEPSDAVSAIVSEGAAA